jgi:hypothetical protein
MSDDTGEAWLKHHAQLASHWIPLYYLTAATAVATLFAGWKQPRFFRVAALAVVMVALSALFAGAVIAESGGKIRHREFRYGPPPADTERQQFAGASMR